MRRFCALMLLICSLLLSGCASHGTEEQLMVVALGVDQAADNKIKVIAKVPSFSGGTSDSGGDSSDGYLTLTASADSFSSAITLLYATAPRTLNYSQTREILLGDGIYEQLPELLDRIGRIDGMRSQATVALCSGKAEEIISQQKAVIGTRLSRYIDTTLETGIREGYIPSATLIRVLTQISGGYQDALLALVGQSAQQPDVTQKQQDGTQQSQAALSQSIDHTAGSMDQVSGKKVEWMGAAAMDGPNIAGILTGFETTLCRFLTQEISVLPFETADGVVSLTPRYGPKLSIREENGVTTLQILADMNILPKLGAQIDLNTAREEISTQITTLVHTLQGMRCDALGFGGIAIRRFATLNAWENSDWKSIYATAQVDVTIRLTLVDE